MPSGRNLKTLLRLCAESGLAREAIDRLMAQPRPAREWMINDWPLWARDDQLAPHADWRVWLLLGGRGAGKTRTGAEWVRYAMRYAGHELRVALVAPSLHEGRAVMIEGNSGLLAVHADRERPRYFPSRREMVFANGSVAQLFSAERPELLRGPQFHLAWCDELAKWRYPNETWDMLQFGLRLGRRPRQVVTTTPRPIPLIRKLLADSSVHVTRSRTFDNADNLAPTFLADLNALYGGSRLGRQELDGEVLDDNPNALFSRAVIDATRVAEHPELQRIVVAIDPPVTAAARMPTPAASSPPDSARMAAAMFSPTAPCRAWRRSAWARAAVEALSRPRCRPRRRRGQPGRRHGARA